MEASWILRILMLGIWLCFMAFSVKKVFLGRASLLWPKIPALVIASHIETKSVRNGLKFYAPIIEFKYKVNGISYTSSNFTYMGTSGFTKKYAGKYTARYFVGKHINIFYNPRNPEMAVIIPGIHRLQYASILVITIFIFGFAYVGEVLNLIFPNCHPNCR
ncbi:hypothetical protein GCM10011352_01180 [Marinobacterium zhoushanense]|uniref:DUF3592 domain-containing protein n=1 Tax=Marinobacterium zhoushanense TaxID=1679163 RepID=A0ABQ1JVQ7_9GAMM|nr:DUF3592 domain-containing protein [Marinobacterium zhoushanense]GGB79286.1 hypothetical protein GCM10011352_01180 [Marinobacterium zhoushanense]